MSSICLFSQVFCFAMISPLQHVTGRLTLRCEAHMLHIFVVLSDFHVKDCFTVWMTMSSWIKLEGHFHNSMRFTHIMPALHDLTISSKSNLPHFSTIGLCQAFAWHVYFSHVRMSQSKSPLKHFHLYSKWACFLILGDILLCKWLPDTQRFYKFFV